MGKYTHKREKEENQEEAKQKEALIRKILQDFDDSQRKELKQKAISLMSDIAQKLGRKIESPPQCIDIGERKVRCYAYITRSNNDRLMRGPYYGRINRINYKIGIYFNVREKKPFISVEAWI